MGETLHEHNHRVEMSNRQLNTWANFTDIVSNSGQYPEIVDYRAEFLGTGPMCRYARDLRPMLIALAGTEATGRLRLDEPVDLRQIRVFYMNEIKDRSFLMSPVSNEVRRTLSDVCNRCSV